MAPLDIIRLFVCLFPKIVDGESTGISKCLTAVLLLGSMVQVETSDALMART